MPPSDGLVNLVAELELRLTGKSASKTLTTPSIVPDASTYVLVLFDGLGHRQLGHPAAADLQASSAATLSAPFPSTTTVSMATVATGLSPRTHGVIGHLMWIPVLGQVVNTLKWVSPAGGKIDHPTEDFLPGPNLWERLAAAGREPITVQPGDFAGSPLSRALYRGCRFEGAWSPGERIEATVQLAATPGRLIFTYFPEVDFAAHVYGLGAPQYRDAVALVNNAWAQLERQLPKNAVAVGTADHGMVEVEPANKLLIRDAAYDELTFFGDPRSLMVRGDAGSIASLASMTGATIITDLPLGPGPDHPELAGRSPDAVLLAPRDSVLLPRGFDKRLTGYHGGMDPRETEVPLLVAKRT